ncbi:MAG: DEAD/DEAH box helicase family protein [Anaerolineae bacterium]|nr:DEAD/DEAH box helicase family protein [Anaerolineae bacterium]
MELKFDANQEYQLAAVTAVADLFTGQTAHGGQMQQVAGQSSTMLVVPNRLELDDAALLANLTAVQNENGITPDTALELLTENIAAADSEESASFYNFSVEMETGTGKTYVYLRTALELARRYGFRKYIIVVPSVAVREGVLKTLDITKRHFSDLYENLPYRPFAYDSANISQIRQFALSSNVEIMVMTLAAFNKVSNVIRQDTDKLSGETPLHLVQATRPILILDEPQNMESEKSIAALAALRPLFALRYSATHRKPYNVVYRLTPFEAYRQGLVKRIAVAGVESEGDTARPYLRLLSVHTQKRTLTARMAVHKRMKSGAIQEQIVTLKPGDALVEATNRPEYAAYVVEEINISYQSVLFANGQEITVGEEIGVDKMTIFDAQIRYAIQEHMRQQRRYNQAGIQAKVLTLFFIDRVDNYANNGPIRQLFDKAFADLKVGYPEWQEKSSTDVQAAYFAQRRTRSGETILEDSKSGEAERDREAYDLIMKAKERLLSFEEDVAFIFSHSALREGWDNPNVCVICTLNQSTSEVKKRQEIGRGVRLLVNQDGERILDEKHNVLTVVANESYSQFVATLQSEIALEYRAEIEARYGKAIDQLTVDERAAIAQEYGAGILPPPPANARQKAKATRNKAYELDPHFQELWERIKHKTRYAVKIDTDRLVQAVVTELDQATIQAPRIAVTKVELRATHDNAFEAVQMATAKTLQSLVGRYALPNLVDMMENLMAFTSPPVRLTRQTLHKICTGTSAATQQAAMDNPNEFTAVAVKIIKSKLVEQLVDGIQYHRLNECYEMTQFEAEIESWEEYLVPVTRSIYDHVIFDAQSQIERDFVAELERRKDVQLYIKLPAWFTVSTPVGTYNPDWAIVMQQVDAFGYPIQGKPALYLVRETKSTHDLDKLRPDERRKIQCGKRHFEALGPEVDYKVIVSASELP